jgi:hypothetical protein
VVKVKKVSEVPPKNKYYSFQIICSWLEAGAGLVLGISVPHPWRGRRTRVNSSYNSLLT